MINNAALDVAIGVILMYLMLSLLCTVINEFIATSVLNLRARSLAAAMAELLDDPQIRKAFYDQGVIASTRSAVRKAASLLPSVRPAAAATNTPSQPNVVDRTQAGDFAAATATAAIAPQGNAVAPSIAHPENAGAGNHLSYISAESFVQTLIGCLAGTRLPAGQPAPDFASIEQTIQKLPPSNIKSALLASLITANRQVDAFRKNVATWFDDSMERLSGAYKRNLKFISLIVGLIIVLVFNADTFGVANALWKDPDLRNRVVSEASDAIKSDDKGACRAKKPAADQSPTANSKTGAGAPQSLEEIETRVTATEDCLRPFPIGWQCAAGVSYVGCVKLHIVGPDSDLTLMQIVGWLVTAAALTLGAPFWFDLLSKFVNIRGAGPKPRRADEK